MDPKPAQHQHKYELSHEKWLNDRQLTVVQRDPPETRKPPREPPIRRATSGFETSSAQIANPAVCEANSYSRCAG